MFSSLKKYHVRFFYAPRGIPFEVSNVTIFMMQILSLYDSLNNFLKKFFRRRILQEIFLPPAPIGTPPEKSCQKICINYEFYTLHNKIYEKVLFFVVLGAFCPSFVGRRSVWLCMAFYAVSVYLFGLRSFRAVAGLLVRRCCYSSINTAPGLLLRISSLYASKNAAGASISVCFALALRMLKRSTPADLYLDIIKVFVFFICSGSFLAALRRVWFGAAVVRGFMLLYK